MENMALASARVISVTGASFLSGFIACFSHAGVPTLNRAPIDILVQEFRTMYNIGKSTSPGIALSVALSNGFLAHAARNGSQWAVVLNTVAAVCVMCIVPFTLLYMDPKVNNTLLDLGEKAERLGKKAVAHVSEAEVRQLLWRWRSLNFMRAGLVAVSALLAAVAAPCTSNSVSEFDE